MRHQRLHIVFRQMGHGVTDFFPGGSLNLRAGLRFGSLLGLRAERRVADLFLCPAVDECLYGFAFHLLRSLPVDERLRIRRSHLSIGQRVNLRLHIGRRHARADNGVDFIL